MALGAEPITTTVEGRERYAVTVALCRATSFSDPVSIARDVLRAAPWMELSWFPLGEVADIQV
jgi:Cu(I)/Ag(I) efflux system membrane protein CusA/SilA